MPSRVIATNPDDDAAGSSFRNNPLRQVRAVYVAFVKGLFAAAPPGAYRWSRGEESELYISDEQPVHAERIGQRPCVSFSRSSVQFYSLGLDDLLTYDSATARKTKATLVPGVMSVNCSSRVDLESEHIAWIISEHLWLLRDRLLRQGFLEIGRQLQTTAPSPAGSIVVSDGGEEWYSTTVMSPFQFPRMSQVTPLNRAVVDSIELSLRQRFSAVNSLGFAGSPNPQEFPVSETFCPPEAFVPGASDARGRAPDPGGTLPSPPPVAPHPLNPAVRVTLRQINPYAPALRPASLGGRVIPISKGCVKQF